MKTNGGIYKIINLIPNKETGVTKIYVGSSVNLKSRKYKHFWELDSNKHKNPHLQNSYNKYGKDNFKWEVIEYIEFNEDKEVLKKNILEREQYWIDKLEVCNPDIGYNICDKAGNTLGYRHSEATKVKIGEFNKLKIGTKRSQESKKKISDSLKNKPKSKEHIESMRKSLKGRTRSEETKKKMSESRKGKKFSKKTRDKISKALKNKPKSKEHIEKLRIARRNYLEDKD